MEYEVKVAEIRTVRKETAKQIESWLSKIETVGTACTGMMEVKGLQGEMAESIKSYIKDIHLSFLVGITQMLSEYKDRLYIYESGYDKIDGAVKAHITQEVLEEQSTKIEIKKEDFLEIVAKLQGALDDVADIFGASAPSTRRICNSFDDLKEKTQKLKEDVGNYEYQHETDCEGVKEQINSIKALIKSLNKGSQINIKSYKAGSILTNLDFQKLQNAYVSSTSYYEGNKESIQEAKDSIDTKEALAEARIQKGAWDIAAAIGTALIVVASVAAIVASGGTATPLVMIALGSTIAYGASNVYEASEDIQYGLAGDIESVSLNPIQDTVFLGNEVAYDTWGMISTGISLGACTPMGSTQKVTAEGIKQAITKFLGSGASNIAKQSISFGGKSLLVAGSGMVTEALVTPYTSEDAGRLMGLMSGAFVASKVFGVKATKTKDKSSTKIDYSNKFDNELRNFNDGYEIKEVVDEDLILVQYSSDKPDASLKYWTTADEANKISTVDEYMDKLALSKDWGSRDTIKVAKIPVGTQVKYAIGTAKAQKTIADPRPGGGLQLLFNEFDTGWVVQVRGLP